MLDLDAMRQIAVALVIALLMMGAGRLILRGEDDAAPAWQLTAGWAAAALVAAICAALGTGVAVPLGLLGVAGLAGWALPGTRALPRIAAAWGLLLPLLGMAAATPAVMFDEFMQWLPNTALLIAHGGFTLDSAVGALSDKPSYPPAIPLLGFAADLLGGDAERAAKLVVLLLAGLFGLVLGGPLARLFGRAGGLVAGVALATVASPFFDPRITLSAYADLPSGLVLALLVLAARERQTARLALGALMLVMLRETNIVFVLALALSRTRAPALLAGAAAGLLPWRLYVWRAGFAPAMAARPMEAWDWSAPVEVLRVLLTDRLAGNPLLGGAALVMLAAGAALAWRLARDPDWRRLAGLAALVAVAWIGFLAWAYAAVFVRVEVANAASTWRYAGQLGPLAMLLLAQAAPTTRWHGAAVAGALAVALLAVQLLPRCYWRLDCRYPDVMAVREIASRHGALIGREPLALLHPAEPGWYAVIVDYTLRRPFGRTVPVAAPPAPTGLRVLDLSALSRTQPRVAVRLIEADGTVRDLLPDTATHR